MSEATWKLLPAPPGTCPECAVAHEPEAPHNAQSLFYQTKFNLEHGRGATWHDAMGHCTEDMKARWVRHLVARGVDLGKENEKEAPSR